MIRATPADHSVLAELLSESFDDNLSVNAAVVQDRHRRRRIRGLMLYSLKYCQAFGEVWLSDNRQACVLLMFPDKKRTTIKTILWDLRLAWHVIGFEKIKPVMKKESAVKAAHPSTPFAYLWFIGVEPSLQGQGHGSQLMQEVIAKCRLRKRPIYLETSVERNLPFYKMFGFEVFRNLDLDYTLYQLRLNF